MTSITAATDSSPPWPPGPSVLRLLLDVVENSLHRGLGPLTDDHDRARLPTPEDAAVSQRVAQQYAVPGLPLDEWELDLVLTGRKGGDVLRLDQPAVRAVLGPYSEDAARRPVGQIGTAMGAALDHGRRQRIATS